MFIIFNVKLREFKPEEVDERIRKVFRNVKSWSYVYDSDELTVEVELDKEIIRKFESEFRRIRCEKIRFEVEEL